MSELARLDSTLRDLAADAEVLADELDPAEIPRGPLRDLLEREFHPDLASFGARLWLESVIDEIAEIVVVPYAAQALALALALRDITEDEVEQAVRLGTLCLDCGVNTAAIGEYYMLQEEVWAEATGPDGGNGMLCIGCLEKRLARQLKPCDFTDAAVNLTWADRSPRLRSRVLGIEETAA